MVYFSEEELCIIEMLTYYNTKEQVLKAAGVPENQWQLFDSKSVKESISDILSPFIDSLTGEKSKYLIALEERDDIIDTEYYISGKEWAGIIEYILKSDKIKNLILTDVSPDGKALCFAESVEATDSAIVAFMGTADQEEWRDNVLAAKLEDSEYQKEAYNYVNRLNYDDITVIGHVSLST